MNVFWKCKTDKESNPEKPKINLVVWRLKNRWSQFHRILIQNPLRGKIIANEIDNLEDGIVLEDESDGEKNNESDDEDNAYEDSKLLQRKSYINCLDIPMIRILNDFNLNCFDILIYKYFVILYNTNNILCIKHI